SVNELRAMLAGVDPGARVVLVMSQCFSGSFANLIDEQIGTDAGIPSRPETCGYFSSTPERMAYGCYAVNRGRENVGHSFRFIHALAGTGSLLDAHLDTLVTDVTPDVPNRTSDFYLDQLLRQAAKQQGVELAVLVDSLLEEAWRDKAAWEPDIRLLDRIGKAFGYFSPRSLAELEEQRTRLPEISGQMAGVSRAWRQTLSDANNANFLRFLEAEVDWKTNLQSVAAGELDQPQIRMLTRTLLEDLTTFTRRDEDVEDRILALHTRREDAAATSYRMEVRLAVVLRMRTVLTQIAGRQYLATRATPEQNAKYASLLECEDLRIPPVPKMAGTLDTPEPFPKFKDDVERATAALPAWMGIRFRDVQEPTRKELGLGLGAARVLTVYPGAPAEKAGLQATDIVTGPPGRPFNESHRIRSWTMLSPIGEPHELEVLREDRPVRITLVPGPYPMKWPTLPGPPEIGSDGPPIELSSYRGDASVVKDGGPYLLFFWATWCGPCKAAIPELLDFEATGVAPVIAITDEPAETLDKFFASDREFPAIVAIDSYRQAFQAYGVSGTPTFVLVDGEGRINTLFSGYSKQKGLGAAIGAMMATGEAVDPAEQREATQPAEPVEPAN
ncbi:MAG: redoxin family protein, partial [Candidatus Binatia bacterium]